MGLVAILKELAGRAQERRDCHHEDSLGYAYENGLFDAYSVAAARANEALREMAGKLEKVAGHCIPGRGSAYANAAALVRELFSSPQDGAQASESQDATVTHAQEVVPFSSAGPDDVNPAQDDTIGNQLRFICERLEAMERFNVRTAGRLDCLYDTLRQALGVSADLLPGDLSATLKPAQSSSSSALVGNSTTTFDEEGNTSPTVRLSAGLITTLYAEGETREQAEATLAQALSDMEEAAARLGATFEHELDGDIEEEEA
jgi:hypothetical protein